MRPPPPKSKERLFERLQKVAHVVYVVGGAVLSAALWSYAHYQSLATDNEVVEVVEAHNKASNAHPSTYDTLQLLLKEQRELKAIVQQGRADDVMLGERLVSLIAADREPDRNRKAQAATWYREEYRRLVRKGETIEDALLQALRTPWRTR